MVKMLVTQEARHLKWFNTHELTLNFVKVSKCVRKAKYFLKIGGIYRKHENHFD
jgi:hypothetical protein